MVFSANIWLKKAQGLTHQIKSCNCNEAMTVHRVRSNACTGKAREAKRGRDTEGGKERDRGERRRARTDTHTVQAFQKIIPPEKKSKAASIVGDHQQYTTTTKDFRSKRGILEGWCTNCQNLRQQQNIHQPQGCTGDVHHGFCGGGGRIVGYDIDLCLDGKLGGNFGTKKPKEI